MCFYTVIRLVSICAKFGIFAGMGLNGTLVGANILTLSQVRILAATCVPFRPTMVQMLNLALIETKGITVYVCCIISLIDGQCKGEYNLLTNCFPVISIAVHMGVREVTLG
jgi:hypothetical protein